ncbi:Uncharacterized protein PECH_002092 [Penicillium ucsense]|uniref:Uncharacterized protein n=1 Tax=Penicillium ucsense TaxID=2839758 RepID=A0A8J8W796_9EURO|nr:Uncharacterized protein PECM_002655 [Penicillium ucsense]KAF7738048.1 Uncharacterized protein PECH_002092 [Penicillium ucsense]
MKSSDPNTLAEDAEEEPSEPLPGTQAGNSKPPLMQRPKSSVVDMTGFSFAKPSVQQKGFALKPIPRSAYHHNMPARGNAKPQREVSKIISSQTQESPFSRSSPVRQDMQHPLQDGSPCPQPKSSFPTHTTFPEARVSPELAEIVMLSDQEHGDSTGNTEAVGQVLDVDTVPSMQTRHGSSIMKKTKIPSNNDTRAARGHFLKKAATQTPSLAKVLKSKDENRVSKTRLENRKAAPRRQGRSNSSNKTDVVSYSEETLFEMLIRRMRQREENEIEISNSQRRIEAQNKELMVERETLHHRLEETQLAVEKKQVEVDKAQSCLKDWKLKIRKLKQVIDELGRDYELLREDHERCKETAADLKQEKNNLFQGINEMRLAISQIETVTDRQREKIAEEDQQIALLEQALSLAQEQIDCNKTDLLTERNRNLRLESFIQNHALSQTKQLRQIEEHQVKAMQQLEIMLKAIATNGRGFKDEILTAFNSALGQVHDSTQTLSERIADEKAEIHNYAEITRDMTSQVEKIISCLADGIESNNEISSRILTDVQESLQTIKAQLVGPESEIFQQLTSCRSEYGSLKEEICAVDPVLNNMNTFLDAVSRSNDTLALRFQEFDSKLEEVKASVTGHERDHKLAGRIAKDASLKIQIEALSSAAESLKELNRNKDVNIVKLQTSLTEAEQKLKLSEARVHDLQTEQTALRGTIELEVQQVRHDMTAEHNLTQKKSEDRFRRELLALEEEMENNLEEAELTVTELREVKDALKAQAMQSLNDHRAERQVEEQAKNQQIEELTQLCAERTAQIEAQKAEIKKYQVAEADSCRERNDLQEQLRQAQKSFHEREQAMRSQGNKPGHVEDSPAGIVPFSQLNNQFSPIRNEFDESADFAMLFMSDEFLLSAPGHQTNKENEKDAARAVDPRDCNENDNSVRGEEVDASKVFDIPQDTDSDLQRANKKRKTVDFVQSQKQSTGKLSEPAATETKPAQGGKQDTQAPVVNAAQPPAKVTKHATKWTYSRIRALETEMQQGQPSTSGRATSSAHRPGVRGLVSASSNPEAESRASGRGRGKRRSRG